LRAQSAIVSAAALGLSVALSLFGVREFGVIGAAAGSVVTLFITEVWSLFVVARALGCSPFKIIGWQVSARVVTVVLIAVGTARVIRASWIGRLDIFERLFAETFLYAVVVVTGLAVMGIHREVRLMLSGALRR
jgi:hypothetical protein